MFNNLDFLRGKRFFKSLGGVVNSDGTVTSFLNLYDTEVALNESDLDEVLKNPVDDWNDNIAYSLIATPAVTYIKNSDPIFFPIRLINIKSDIYDWSRAEGTYQTSDGTFNVSVRSDNRYADDLDYDVDLSILLTDNTRGTEHVYSGYITGNSVVFGDDFSVLTIQMTLNPDGTLSVTDGGDGFYADYTLNIAGEYEKISDEVHDFPFKIRYSYYNMPIEDNEDSMEEPRDVVYYSIPKITGLGDEAFEDYVNKYIEDAITNPAKSFEKEYRELLENKDDDPFMAELADRYGYGSDVYVLTTSDDYYAIITSGYEYRGGAHGMPFRWICNISVGEKKILALGDLFENTDYREIIEQKMEEMLTTDEYEYLVFPGTTEVKLYEDESNFYLTDGNLVIYYHPYDVGPYAAGFIRFKIPLTELADIMKPEYLNAEYTPGMGEYILFDSFD